jgi:hypothetical protein
MNQIMKGYLSRLKIRLVRSCEYTGRPALKCASTAARTVREQLSVTLSKDASSGSLAPRLLARDADELVF